MVDRSLREEACISFGKISRLVLNSDLVNNPKIMSHYALLLAANSAINQNRGDEQVLCLVRSPKVTPETRAAMLKILADADIYIYTDGYPHDFHKLGSPVKLPCTFISGLLKQPRKRDWVSRYLWKHGHSFTVEKSSASSLLAHATVLRARLPNAAPIEANARWKTHRANDRLGRDKDSLDFLIYYLSAQVE